MTNYFFSMKHSKKRAAIFLCGHLIDPHAHPSLKVESGVKKNSNKKYNN